MRSKQLPIPPGLDRAQEQRWFLTALTAASTVSFLIFISHYTTARAALFDHYHRNAVLIPGAIIESFPALLYRVLDPFFLLLLCLPFWVALHYMHYRRGSMSIYLMRRLPDRSLLHRQCWTLPLLGLAAAVLIGLLLLGLCFLIYRYATPAQCLPLAYRR